MLNDNDNQPFLAVMDPVWPRESGGGKVKRGADRHYALAKNLPELAQGYIDGPLWQQHAPGLVWCWVTNSAMLYGDHMQLGAALNLKPCTSWVWWKSRRVEALVREEGWGWAPERRMGLGQWQRTEHEHLVLFKRGAVKVPTPPYRERSVVSAPRGRHSEKPDAAWHLIERVSRHVLGHGVLGVEFNARALRPGWVTVGTLDGEDKPIRSAMAVKENDDG